MAHAALHRPASLEFPGAAEYEINRTDGCGCNATIGNDCVALHLGWKRWAWHARAASRYYLSFEIAQGTVHNEVTDAQVRAVAWCIRDAQDAWDEEIPLHMPTHAELEASGQTGKIDGKTDVYPAGDPRADQLRARILAVL